MSINNEGTALLVTDMVLLEPRVTLLVKLATTALDVLKASGLPVPLCR